MFIRERLKEVLHDFLILQDHFVDSKKIWITWEKQRRNQSMCLKLGVACHELISPKRGLRRYIELMIRTILLVKKERPNVLFVQNPSIVLCFLMVICRPFLGYRLIVDEHNAGIFPLEGRSRLLNTIAKFIARKADFVIVTNTVLKEICDSWGALAYVVPDPLPDFDGFSSPYANRKSRESNPIVMLFICTWAADEPYAMLISAASAFDRDSLIVRITGNPKEKVNQSKLPPNIELMGFIPDDEYVRELKHCDGVIVLTSRENCLNCGAYEAVSLEKPGILSDTKALRNYFSKGFLFTSINSEKCLVRSIENFISDREILEKEVKILKKELRSYTAPFENIVRAL